MENKRFIVTLDGPGGVGKTTLAKRVAKELSVAYLDTGAMFRATALKLGEGAWERSEEKLQKDLRELSFTLSGTGEDSRLRVNNALVGDEIRTEAVGMWASNIAVIPVVRAFQKQAQQAIGAGTSLVCEGRDMGTVVFPNAKYKFFLDASPEIRAERRFKQLQEMGQKADLKEITAGLQARDQQDTNRAEAPLKPAKDAVIIDTGGLSIDGVFERIMERIRGA
ncbi:MAG: (d)CMP kinase [Thermodesulfobacteriota bacterium]|nr:(d)CMP kinase [Thermodesulfobacteriota bacterium]